MKGKVSERAVLKEGSGVQFHGNEGKGFTKSGVKRGVSC